MGIAKPCAENLNKKAMSCKALIKHQVHLLCSPPGLALPLVLGGYSLCPGCESCVMGSAPW